MADLAILIATLVRRRGYLDRLMRCLQPQLSDRVSIFTLEDAGVENIGVKRQRMIESVSEPYLCFIDDDDLVSGDYCGSILAALDQNPDVVGFRLRYYEDGKPRGTSMHSMTAKNWRTERQRDGTAKHYRTPNHLNPVRTELARAAGFPPLDTGEDAEYSGRLFRMFPNMREVFIDQELYYYLYRHPNFRVESESIAVEDFA
jgi:hypothetical protein